MDCSLQEGRYMEVIDFACGPQDASSERFAALSHVTYSIPDYREHHGQLRKLSRFGTRTSWDAVPGFNVDQYYATARDVTGDASFYDLLGHGDPVDVQASSGSLFDLVGESAHWQFESELPLSYKFRNARMLCAYVAQMLAAYGNNGRAPLLADGRKNLFFSGNRSLQVVRNVKRHFWDLKAYAYGLHRWEVGDRVFSASLR
jgi:hypothetical protein